MTTMAMMISTSLTMLVRSRDDLQQQLGGCLPSKQFTGEDQWFSKEKLYKVGMKRYYDDDDGDSDDSTNHDDDHDRGDGEFSKGAPWSSVEFSEGFRGGSFYSLSRSDPDWPVVLGATVPSLNIPSSPYNLQRGVS